MFRLFKRKRSASSPLSPLYTQLGRAVQQQQRRWANYLNRRAENLSPRTFKIALLLICLGFGSISLYVGILALDTPDEQHRPPSITVPRHVQQPDPLTPYRSAPVLSDKQYGRLEQFKKYMDSLRQSASGKPLYDSILLNRSGLMDSIALVEQLYQQQLKSK